MVNDNLALAESEEGQPPAALPWTAMRRRDPDFLARLAAYADQFRGDFHRSDQARWVRIYLQGLLQSGPRKNIETLASSITLPPDLMVEDVPQALQNFVNQSPWDERKLLARYRGLLREHLADSPGHFFIDDVTFPKKGRFSAGVHRQYSRERGRKVNCQIAVALYHVGPAGCFPLALRLYLPQSWLREPERLDAVGVPQEFRRSASKAQVALELLDELAAEGFSAGGVVVGAGAGDAPALREGLVQRALVYLPAGTRDIEAVSTRSLNRSVEDVLHLLKQELGLEHFEGRSWRGFHHHACLVMLAYGFLALPHAT